MSKKLLIVFLSSVFSFGCASIPVPPGINGDIFQKTQKKTITAESVRLADMFTDNAWQSMEQVLPTFISGIEVQLRSGGATERTSKVFGAELKKSMSRDAFAKAIAEAISKRMNTEEIKELSAFLQSAAGKKYLQLNKDLSTDPSFVAPMLRQACEASARQLNDYERGTIARACGQF